jgi:hypothetical protein
MHIDARMPARAHSHARMHIYIDARTHARTHSHARMPVVNLYLTRI